MEDSIAKQLAERRARLQRDRQQANRSINTDTQHIQNHSSNINHDDRDGGQPSHSDHSMDDYEFARQLQSQFEAEDNNQSNPIQSPPAAVSAPEVVPSSSGDNQSTIDRDHEIAIQLQRQFEQENSNVPPPSSAPPNYNNNHNINNPSSFPLAPEFPENNFGGFSFSSSSSSNPNGNGGVTTIIRTQRDANGNVVRTVTTNSMGGMNGGFPAMRGMSSSSMPGMEAFNHPFFQRNANNENNANSFDSDLFGGFGNMENFRMQGMPPMLNMNMMVNNLMLGGGDDDMPMGLYQLLQQRPRVANRENIEALPTDTYKVKPNPTSSHSDSNSNGVDIDMTMDENEDEDHGDESKTESESCSICLEPFKDGEEIRRLPCLHIFHKNEIDRWLLTGADRCPICRMPINGQMQNN